MLAVILTLFAGLIVPGAAGAASHWFGRTVAVSGDTLVVGENKASERYNNDSGFAYVFEHNASGAWNQTAKLTAFDGAADDEFGFSVSISGDIVVVGSFNSDGNASSSGAVYVFEKDASDAWAQTAKLTASDGAAKDGFGGSVSVSGDTLVVGTGKESAYVFEKDASGAWTQKARLIASGIYGEVDGFGLSVSVSGDIVAVGAYFDYGNASDSGAAYVFKEPDTGWAGLMPDTTILTASDGVELDWFGNSVSISGDIVVVGAPRNKVDTGAAYVFEEPDTGWDSLGSDGMTQAAKLTASDGQNGDDDSDDGSLSFDSGGGGGGGCFIVMAF